MCFLKLEAVAEEGQEEMLLQNSAMWPNSVSTLFTYIGEIYLHFFI